jgi:drug/metabolite transporter (DMT)-like permease
MVSQSRAQALAVFALALLAITWGAIPLFVRNEVPSIVLVGVRVTFGAVALIGVAAVLGKLEFPKVRRWRIVLSGVLLALHWITFFQAIKLTTVAVSLAIVYMGLIAAAILSGPFLGERGAPRLWVALGIAVTGLVLVLQPWATPTKGDGVGITVAGVLVAGISAALFTAVILVGKPVARDLGGLAMTIGELTVASVLLAPATVQAVTQYSEYMMSFLILGALFTGLGGLVFWESIRYMPVAAASVIMYLEPASAVIWAAAFLGEVPNTTTWLGVGLVVASGVVAATASSAAAEEEILGAPTAL